MPNINIKPATINDLAGIKLLQPQGWADIMPNMQFYIDADYCHLAVAIENNIVKGCGAVITHKNCCWLANIIVGEQYRNGGIGSNITSYLHNYALSKNSTINLIATKFGYPIYKKLGYNDDEGYLFFDAKTHQQNISPHIKPYHQSYKQNILELDKSITGENREALLIPRLNEAFVYVDQDDFKGFTIPTLGEGLALASHTNAGLALMLKKLELVHRFAIPKINTSAINFLLDIGYSPLPDLFAIKMWYGKQIKWQPKQVYGRVGGNMG